MWYWINLDSIDDTVKFADLESAVAFWLDHIWDCKLTWLKDLEGEIRQFDEDTTVRPKRMTKNRLLRTVFSVYFYESDSDELPYPDSDDTYASVVDDDGVRYVTDEAIRRALETVPDAQERVQTLNSYIGMIARLSEVCVESWTKNQFVWQKIRWYRQRDQKPPMAIPKASLDQIQLHDFEGDDLLRTYHNKRIYPDHDDYGSI